MNQPLETRTLSDYLRMLRAQLRLIVLATLVAAGAALVLSLAQHRTYEASSTIGLTADFFPQGNEEQGAAATAAIGLAAGDQVFTRVSKALGGSPTPDQLRSSVTDGFQPGSNLVTITASSSSPEQAARIANEFASAAKIIGRDITKAKYLRQARIQDDSTLRRAASSVDPVDIVQSARVPTSPTSPRPLRNTFIAACIGFLIGLGLALLRQSLDRRVTTADEVRRELELPLVGYVRSEMLGWSGMSANGAGVEAGDDLEAFRILRTNVDFLAGDENLTTLAVTSPLPEEGKSTVSAGIAYANALAGRRAVLVECDFRRPVMAERFGLDAAPGLSDHLLGNAKPSEVLRLIELEGPSAEPLPVIPAGVGVSQPGELLASPRFGRFLAQIAKAYEVVILDCAPLLPVGDALELLPQVDGVLLCIRLGQTTHEQARSAKEAMGHLPARPTGLVITGLGRGSEDDYYGYYATHAQLPAGR